MSGVSLVEVRADIVLNVANIWNNIYKWFSSRIYLIIVLNGYMVVMLSKQYHRSIGFQFQLNWRKNEERGFHS